MLNLQGLRALGLDVEEGMAYCADDEDFYEEMLGEYVREAQAGLEDLTQEYASRDWERYALRAHTIKSTSRMIGAKEVSEKARQMEISAKTGAEEMIHSMHEPFLAEYRSLTEEIRKNIG